MKPLLLSCALCATLTIGVQPVTADSFKRDNSILLAQNQSPQRPLDVPFVPTTTEVVAEMLRLGEVGKNDLVYDLGSGDGRIVITAAKQLGARGVGVDIDPQRVREARDNAKKEGVTDKVTFMQQDLFNTDLRDATVVTLYLLPAINLRLRPKLLSELKPGTKVVSHNYDMGDWKPEKTVTMGSHTIYVWTVPERGQGGTATKQ